MNYHYYYNNEDQRFFPLLPFLVGAAVSPYLYGYGHGYPYYGHHYPYYGPYNYGYNYGHKPYGYYW